MRYVVISDLHNCDLFSFEQAAMHERPDYLICLGDFDTVDTIRHYIDLEKRLSDKGTKVITVPGNHDHAIYHDLPIISPKLIEYKLDSHTLHEELMADPVAKDYIEGLLERPVKELKIEDLPAIILHGGLAGDEESHTDASLLWNRMIKEETITRNFELMEKKGYRIMIRGHDHWPLMINESEEKMFLHGGSFRLQDEMHILNPGPLHQEHYILIEDKVVHYKKTYSKI